MRDVPAFPAVLPTLDGVIALTPSRAAALRAWRQQNRSADADEATLNEAAALAALIETDAGPRFEGASFAELVGFIEELPF